MLCCLQAAEVQRLLVQAQQEAAAVDGALCAEVAGVAAACQAMQAQLQQALEAAADWQGQTEQLQQQVGELQQQIVQLQEERGQLQEQVGELQQQLTAAASELPALPEVGSSPGRMPAMSSHATEFVCKGLGT